MRISHFFLSLTGLFFIYGCSSSKKLNKETAYGISGLRYINEYIVPNGIQFKETTIGGLSGIDYDKARDVYYLICDDPSSKGPARFYTAKILISEKGIDSVAFIDVTTILDPKGNAYPDITKDLLHSADLEAMRYDPQKDILVRSTEGQRRVKDDQQQLQDATIVIMNRNGQWKDSFALPANMKFQAIEKGPRHNSVFEGLDFADNYKTLYVSLEEALYEDAAKAGNGDSTSWVRFLKFDLTTKKQIAQYAYEIGAIPYPANPSGAFKINGVSDIMYLGNEKFIVIERAYSTGRIPTDIKVYMADAAGAEDISPIASLKQQPAKKYITKKLLLDMNKELSQDVFNVEGVSFGPILPNGHRTLIFVTDNNFNVKEKTQFFLFEVLP